MMIHHRQEQSLFPELKHIPITSLAFLGYTMRKARRGEPKLTGIFHVPTILTGGADRR